MLSVVMLAALEGVLLKAERVAERERDRRGLASRRWLLLGSLVWCDLTMLVFCARLIFSTVC
jgi:hypothetical protein